MTELKGQYKQILERVQKERTKFNDLQEEFHQHIHYGKNGYLAKNNVGGLMNKNLSSNPEIPRFYYEYEEGGIYYVYDGLTGKPIRKDTSILLEEGIFVEYSEHKLLNLGDMSVIQAIAIAVLTGDMSRVDKFKGKIATLDGYYYQLFDIANYTFGVSLRGLAHVADRLFQDYTVSRGFGPQMTTPEYWRNRELVDDLLNYINTGIGDTDQNNLARLEARVLSKKNIDNGKTSAFLVSDDYPFARNMYIYGSKPQIDNLRYVNNQENQPYLILNSGNPNINFGTPRFTGRDVRHYTRISDYGGTYRGINRFDLWLFDPNPAALTVNLPTSNNKGSLLSHNANVLDYKMGFLMTDLEKKLQKNANIKPVFMGIELEVVSRADRANTIMEIAQSPFGNHCVMVSDSSIDGEPGRPGTRGIEIVTVPATLAYHKQMFSDHFFSNSGLNKEGFERQLISNNRCGIHVHVGKDSFTVGGIAKFIAFLNSEATREFVANVAGRALNNRFNMPWELRKRNKHGVDLACSVGTTLLKASESVKRGKGTSVDNGRWKSRAIEGFARGAVHVGKEKTIEVRIFKSTTSKTNLLKKIEFVHALVCFANSGVSAQELTVKKFIEFVLDKTNRKDYPYLLNWLSSKNYIARKATSHPVTNKKFFRYEERSDLTGKQA